MNRAPGRVSAVWILLAMVFAAGVWLFAQRVLIPYQIRDAVAHERPRGNLSDLYPRWIGARALLLQRRDPYGEGVAREIQTGYYGRPLDPARSGDPRDQQGFAYPVYIVFWLAPTLSMPFAEVERGFLVVLIVLTSVSVLFWLKLLNMSLRSTGLVVALVLTLGSLPVMQGLKLEQLSLLIAGLIAVAVWLLARGHLIGAGGVLAAASVKPQLLVFLLIWLAIWAAFDLRRRSRWALSFVAVMVAQLAGAEYYLPGWIPRFLRALRDYRQYTGAVSVSHVLAGPVVGSLIEFAAFILFLRLCWRQRAAHADSPSFAYVSAAVLALTVLLQPTDSVYNQVLLLPAILAVVRDIRSIWSRSIVTRGLLVLGVVLTAWPFLSSTILAGLSFVFPREAVERAWQVPFWTAFAIPLVIAAVMLACSQSGVFPDSDSASSS